MLISKGNSLEREMLGENRCVLAKIHLILYKKQIVCYANVFYLVHAELVRRKVRRFCLDDPYISPIYQGMLYLEFFLIYFGNFHFLVYQIKYHNTLIRGLINDLYIVSNVFPGILTESHLIRPIDLLHFLIF